MPADGGTDFVPRELPRLAADPLSYVLVAEAAFTEATAAVAEQHQSQRTAAASAGHALQGQQPGRVDGLGEGRCMHYRCSWSYYLYGVSLISMPPSELHAAAPSADVFIQTHILVGSGMGVAK